MPSSIHEANKKVSFGAPQVIDEVMDFIQKGTIKADPKKV
jgi:hypothetical protein